MFYLYSSYMKDIVYEKNKDQGMTKAEAYIKAKQMFSKDETWKKLDSELTDEFPDVLERFEKIKEKLKKSESDSSSKSEEDSDEEDADD